MSMTLLELVQTAQAELGLFPVATTVIGNTDNTVQQLLYLANALGRDLVTERAWAAQQRTNITTTETPQVMTGNITDGSGAITGLSSSTAGLTAHYYMVTGQGIPSAARLISVDSASSVTLDSLATTTATGVTITFAKDRYNLPSDFDYFVPKTQWDRSNHWPLIGPMSPQEDEWVRSGVVTTGPRRRIRLTSLYTGATPDVIKSLEIWPPPQATEDPITLSYEYISTNWVRYQFAVGIVSSRTKFQADTDQNIFPNALMVAGLKYKFWGQKGFDTSILREEFERIKQKAIAKDWGSNTLDMRRRRTPYFLVPGNVQDANFPGP